MEANISLEKDQFEPNEVIKINFNIDNSKCGKDVKSYKIKLHREISILDGERKPIFLQNDYLEEQKQPVDVKAKMKSEKTITYKIPAHDKVENVGNLHMMHPTLQLLINTFSVSIARKRFSVKYRMDLFIKHSALTEFGQGNFVSFPITIRSVAHKIKVL